jgi:hypothetical protein
MESLRFNSSRYIPCNRPERKVYNCASSFYCNIAHFTPVLLLVSLDTAGVGRNDGKLDMVLLILLLFSVDPVHFNAQYQMHFLMPQQIHQ